MLDLYDQLYDKFLSCSDEERAQFSEIISQNGAELLEYDKTIFALNSCARAEQMIVSLTSIPERINCVVYPIECMLAQTVKPDKIILWLDQDRFDDGSLPEKLLQLKQYGLTIKYVTDIGPHTKYYYAMRQYPDALIITIDDDVFYKRTLIEELCLTHKENPNCVCAHWVKRMKFTCNGIPYPYQEFDAGEGERNYEPAHSLVALGIGGVLYPPHCLDETTLDLELIKNISIKNDDLWLKAMEIKSDVKVARVNRRFRHPPVINDSQQVALKFKNCLSRNDQIIKTIFQYFHFEPYFVSEKNEDYLAFNILERWLVLYQKGITIENYLIQHHIMTVAIYGMGRVGTLLLKDLLNSKIKVLYGIDRQADLIRMEVPIIKPQQLKQPVDMVIVAANVEFQKLRNQISQFIDCNVMTLDDLLVEMNWQADKF